jgi:hypothetical protein
MGQIGACPMEQFQVRIQETDRVCCSSGCGGKLTPAICDPACAVVWNDLFTDCAATLSGMVPESMPEFTAFQGKCLALDKHSLLDAIAAATCRTFAAPFPFTTDAVSSGADGVLIYGKADTVVNTYHAVTQAMVPGGSTTVEVDDTYGLAAGDVVMIVQSADDRGSAGAFEFAVVKAVVRGTASVELATPLSHTFASGGETLWRNVGDGACAGARGGSFARGVLASDFTLAECKARCEAAGDLCVGLQYTPPARDARASMGQCTLLALSEADSSAFEDRAGEIFDEWFDPVDDDLPAGGLPVGKAATDGGGAAPGTACWALTTPATPAAVWELTSLTATCAGADGIAAIGTDPSRRSAPACQAACETTAGCLAVDFSAAAGCVFYPQPCQNPRGAAGAAYHMAGRLPRAADGGDAYAGCYQDCATMAGGQTADRICDDLAATGVSTPAECQQKCAGFTYMGLACPIAGSSFECWCCDSLDLNSDGTERLADSECSGGRLTSGINGNENEHCNGYPEVGAYVAEGYKLGGYCRAAIYATTARAAPLPTRAAQLVKIPQAASVHVLPGATLVAAPWDGRKGGILALMAAGDIVIDGQVSALGAGYRGGAAHNDNADGSEGESYRGNGDGVSSYRANYGGGGGGEWRMWAARVGPTRLARLEAAARTPPQA